MMHGQKNIKTLVTGSRCILLRMRNVSDKGCRENENTFYVRFSENLAFYEMWKNVLEPGRPQMTIWRMRIACYIPKAKNTHSEYVIAFFTETIITRTRLCAML
jgi:hypothetical protein